VNRSPNPTDQHVGKRVRMRRLMLDMSQTDLANGLGVTFQQVQKYENGKNRVSASRLQQISQILQVPVPFFFEGGPRVKSTTARTAPPHPPTCRTSSPPRTGWPSPRRSCGSRTPRFVVA
jgi:transcriptional regulator with XRE-family HTH domain